MKYVKTFEEFLNENVSGTKRVGDIVYALNMMDYGTFNVLVVKLHYVDNKKEEYAGKIVDVELNEVEHRNKSQLSKDKKRLIGKHFHSSDGIGVYDKFPKRLKR